MLTVQNRYFNTDFNNHAEVLSSSLGEEETKIVFQNIIMCIKENFSYRKIYNEHLFSLIL